MPPERQLAVAFGTARSTIRKALDQLEQKGLVVRRVGSGTFVSYQGPVQDAMADVTDLISPLQLIEARIAIEPCDDEARGAARFDARSRRDRAVS